MQCRELIAYRIKAGEENRFDILHRQILEQIKDLFPGLISCKTFQDIKSPTLLFDELIWNSREDALNAYQGFKTLKNAAEFMTTVDEVIFKGHFEEL